MKNCGINSFFNVYPKMNRGGSPFSIFHFSFFMLIAICAISGCRRSDVREFTVELPGLTEANKAQVVEALAKYDGVKKDSYVFDFGKKTLTLRYDSMKVARENVRQAIEAKGVKVIYPEVKGGYAGYLNEKEK